MFSFCDNMSRILSRRTVYGAVIAETQLCALKPPLSCDESISQSMKPPKLSSKANCEDPVCKKTSDMFAKALKGVNDRPVKAPATTKQHCPLDVDALGRSAWDLIHTMAAYYPEIPSDEQRLAATAFFTSLALLYPCHICAEDFQESVTIHPPRYS